jgi:uncharacterized protein
MYSIKQLFIYPIKSLGGISVQTATITATGFAYDRKWMLVDAQNNFLSQRTVPLMAHLQTAITNEGILVYHRLNAHHSIIVPYFTGTGTSVQVHIWNDVCSALHIDDYLDAWFSEQLQMQCKLVYMPDTTQRQVDATYARSQNHLTAFSDGFPLLLIGQESLNELNRRLPSEQAALSMERFRPNLVFEGGQPFAEDTFAHFSINQLPFWAVKPCARCSITTLNQSTLAFEKEPLKTLAQFRKLNNKIYFGQNILCNGVGSVSVGNSLQVIESKASIFVA